MAFSWKIPDSSEYTVEDEIFITKLKLLDALKAHDKEAVVYFEEQLNYLKEKNNLSPEN